MPSPRNAKFARDNLPRPPFSTPFQPKIPGRIHPGQPTEAFKNPIHESEQNVFILWKDITRIKVKSKRRCIHTKREWGFKPIGLYCTPENFSQKLEILRN